MDGSNRLRRPRSLQERLGLVCCGSTWGNGRSTMSVRDEDENDIVDPAEPLPDVIRTLPERNLNPECVLPSPRMNLAAALEAERHSRSMVMPSDGGEPLTQDIDRAGDRLTGSYQNATHAIPATPTRMSLMRLLEETDDQDEKEGVGVELVCCVCMGRKKGAAFIPCGHTFCRVCSRELWLNRGSCPLCNRMILEILDIF